MFMHNKRLMYTVRVSEPNPVLATMMLEQFGGPQGELAAAMRYFTQALAEDDPGRKDMLLDIATEELSHLEVIGSIVAMLNKGVKGQLAEGNPTKSLQKSCSVEIVCGASKAADRARPRRWRNGPVDLKAAERAGRQQRPNWREAGLSDSAQSPSGRSSRTRSMKSRSAAGTWRRLE